MRRKIGKQALVYTLIGTTVLSNVTPAFASESHDVEIHYGAGITEDHVCDTQDVTEDQTSTTTVYAELGKKFTVTIPKALTLSGINKKGSYTVSVEGDIAGTDKIKVVPDETFALRSSGLADVTATITQDKTEWTYSEILGDGVIGQGAIDANKLSAGRWNGTFNFNVTLEENESASGSESTNSRIDLSTSDAISKKIEAAAGDRIIIDIFMGEESVTDRAEWTSDNENVTVDKGIIKVSKSAKDGETANVIATVDDKTVTIIITIKKDNAGSDEEQSKLTLSESNVAMGVDDSVQVNAFIDGKNVNESVSWESDNENIIVTNGLVETNASAQVGDTATVTVSTVSDVSLLAEGVESTSAQFKVTIIDMEYTADGKKVTSIDLKAGESKDVEVTIIPASASGTVKWSTTASSGINLVKNDNTVTVKIADDMEAGKSYDLVATYGDYSKILKINIISDHVHSYDAGVVTKEATCTDAGVKTFSCKCGESYTEEISATGHKEVSANNAVAATCTVAGKESDTKCSVCNATIKTGKAVSATGHSYGTVTYNWTGNTSCKASRTCSKCSNVESETVNSTNAITKAATCTDAGVRTYTATFKNTVFAKQTKTEAISATGHNYENGTCTDCGTKDPDYVAQEAGLYDANGVMLCTWEESGIDVETNYTTSNYKTSPTSGYYILTNKYPKTTKVVIPEGVTSIGNYAFYNCTGLTSIEIPEGVTSIGNYAFYNCTGLTSIEIPEGVTSIGDRAFSYCTGLTSITIPESVTSIGSNAFYYCTGLTSINVDINNKNYCSVDGVLFKKDMTTLIKCPSGKTDTSYTIPEGVTSIGNYAFSNCTGLTSIEIPEGVTSIEDWAFSYCTGLTSITIPESVTSIGNYAFYNCTDLTSVTIPEGVTSIGGSTFYGCTGLTSITIPESVTSIGNWAFSSCTGLTSITIPKSVTSIGSGAFSECTNLTSVTFKNTSGWYVGDSAGAKTTSISSSSLSKTSTAATYLKSTYYSKYWTR